MKEWRNSVSCKYLLDLRNFFSNYFDDEIHMNSFIYNNLKCKDNRKRRMMNMVMRHVKISEYMENYKHYNNFLALINLIISIEAVYIIKGESESLNKVETLIDFFSNHLCKKDKEKIEQKFQIDITDNTKDIMKDVNFEVIEIFARYLNELRNIYVHEGDYWNRVFTSDNEYPMLQILKFKLSKNEKELKITILNSLTIKDIKYAIVYGLINYIKS